MITLFGAAFLPLTLLILIFRRDWLLPLLIISAVFQSPSVINIPLGDAQYGVTPFNIAALAVAAHFLEIVFRRRSISLGPKATRPIMLLLLGYGLIAIIGAFTLPFMFEGMPVYLLINKAGFNEGTTPLRWTISNAAQAINTAIMMMTLLYFTQQYDHPTLRRRILVGFVIALLVSVLAGAQQRLGWLGFMPVADEWWASNPSYAQNFLSYGVIDFLRVNWPFTEPSYASAWFAALFGGGAFAVIYSRRAALALFITVLAAAGLGNTLGATGFFAAAATLLALAVVAALTASRNPRLRRRIVVRGLLSIAALAALVVGTLSLLNPQRSQTPGQDIYRYYEHKLTEQLDWSARRLRSDLHALEVVKQSRGLGVGVGSNRSNSYFLSLLSNAGVGGALLLVAALFATVWAAMRRTVRGDPDDDDLMPPFAGGALLAATLAMASGIPDINIPLYWIVFIAALMALMTNSPPKPAGLPARIAETARTERETAP